MKEVVIEEPVLLRAALARVAEGVAITTAGPPPDGGVVVFANPAFARAAGWEVDDLVGRTMVTIGSPSLVAAVSAALRAGDGYRGRWRRERLLGSPHELECCVRPLDGDGVEPGHWLWVLHPAAGGRADSPGEAITEEPALPRVEDTRQENRDLLRAIIEASDDLVTLSDRDGRFRLISSSATLLGCGRAEDLLGHGHADLFAPADAPRMRAQDQQVLETGKRFTVEHTLEVAGRRRHFLTTRAPQRDAGGAIVGVIAVSRDITEFKEAQRRLVHSERLASVGTLAAGIAHEINNPVGGILLSAQGALDELARGEDAGFVERCLREIVEDAKRCGRIIQSVLRFSRDQPTEKWPGDLNEVVRRALHLLSGLLRQHGVTTELHLAPDLPLVPVNQTEVEQVLVNLIQNAVEMSGVGARIVVHTQRRDGGVRLSVADNGPGMLPEQLEHVFDPFYTTRQQRGGTGLGLSVVHGIVQGHGGHIDVHSKLDEGTVFTIDLPC